MARTTGIALLASGYGLGPDAFDVVPGLSYTGSFEAKNSVTGPISVGMDWLDAAGGFLSNVAATPTVQAGVPTRVSVTAVAPAGAARVLIIPSTFPSNAAADVTAFLIEQSDTAGTYFDGDTPGAVWDGVAGDSSSTLAGSGAPAVNAGTDVAAHPAGTVFTRTATEDSGAAITSRSWTIVSGPTTGAGLVTGRITRSGDRLLRDGVPWWFLGYNSFVWSANCGASNELMTAAQVDAWFSSMRHDGHGAARLFFYRGWDYARLDAAVASARAHNIYLIITLDDAIGGCGENAKNAAWFNNQVERDDFEAHLTAVLDRYRGERQILAVEYFNEPNTDDATITQLRQFYDEMGVVARAVDPERLMCSGTVAAYGVGGNVNYLNLHQSPGVDIASLHEYDQQEIISNHLSAAVANSAGKPVIVGEWGINANETGAACEMSFAQRAVAYQQKADAYIRYAGCSGGLVWAWQPGGAVGSCGFGTVDRDTASQTSMRDATYDPGTPGTVIGTSAALSWIPPVLGSYVLRYSATNSAGTGTDDVAVTAVSTDDALFAALLVAMV